MVSDSLTDAGYRFDRTTIHHESPMLIVCPNCATSYRVAAASLGATGRSVRCVRCRNVWFARDPAALEAIARAHRADIEAFAGPLPDPDAAGEPDLVHGVDMPDAAFPPALSPEIVSPDPEGAPAQIDAWPDPLSAQEPDPRGELPSLTMLEPALTDAAPAEDIETFAARRNPRRAKRMSQWALPVLPLMILALIALDAALIAWRVEVVKVAPQTASLYAAIGLPVNLRGLTFSDVTTATETQDGVQVLVVEGTIASASPRVVEVPRLRFSVRDSKGHEVYAWTALPTRSLLSPGETLAFRSRLASPPTDARDVLVRFFNRRDLVAGI